MKPIVRAVFVLLLALPALAQRQMEALGRGVVALPDGAGRVYVSWRLLGTDPDEIAFNVYRVSAPGAEAVRLNTTPLRQTTDFVDSASGTTGAPRYFVRPVLGVEEWPASAAFTVQTGSAGRGYLSIPIEPPPNGITPDGLGYSYTANDCSAADLDGDGEYELILKWDPTNAKDNSQSGYTGNVFLDAYRLDGTRLWRLDLGHNIRAGAHYTQFIAYDLDGDGRAEIACKTADGSIDATGRVIGNAGADHRNSAGYVLRGPEFLTIFDGRTGAALATTSYVPARNSDPASDDVTAWGDNYGNRVDRFLAGVAYLEQTAEPDHVSRLLHPHGSRRVGLARRAAHPALAFRHAHRHRSAQRGAGLPRLGGNGQPPALDRRRRRRRPRRNHLRRNRDR